jgi:hypothetical protein
MIHTMIDVVQEAITGSIEAPFNEKSLAEENAFLRSIVVDLLIKNQKLRCEEQKYAYQAAGY